MAQQHLGQNTAVKNLCLKVQEKIPSSISAFLIPCSVSLTIVT